MTVLSLFDGISCGQVALKKAGILVTSYYASEIDKYALSVTQHNHPDTIQLGSVVDLQIWQLAKIPDLVIGGSPCQGFSFAGKQLNFQDPRSKLFFEYIRILQEVREENPAVKFLLENVKMSKESENVISDMLGVEPVLINSALVSAQNRNRLYWANFPITQPADLDINLLDILDNVSEYVKIDRKNKVKKYQKKASCLTGGARGDGCHSDMDLLLLPDGSKRRYSVNECERLQGLPDNYISGLVSNTQAYKALANGWNVDTISHIFKCLKSIL